MDFPSECKSHQRQYNKMFAYKNICKYCFSRLCVCVRLELCKLHILVVAASVEWMTHQTILMAIYASIDRCEAHIEPYGITSWIPLTVVGEWHFMERIHHSDDDDEDASVMLKCCMCWCWRWIVFANVMYVPSFAHTSEWWEWWWTVVGMHLIRCGCDRYR